MLVWQRPVPDAWLPPDRAALDAALGDGDGNALAEKLACPD
jgi:hypothetical protein